MSNVIPQASPGRVVATRAAEVAAAIQRVTESGRYILGPEVEAFEREFAAYLGVDFGVGVANGTDALELALRAVGVRSGDLVFTVSHTAVATVAAIERSGAVPVLVDIDPETFTMHPDRLNDALDWSARHLPGARPAAVVLVHLYGRPADIESVGAIARNRGLKVVEDCAQAHGALAGKRKVGSIGDAAAFSFYPTKNLAAMGDAGMVVTRDSDTAEQVMRLRQYGWSSSRSSDIRGFNSRLDELQAAILRVGLAHLDTDNARRAEIARRYDDKTGAGLTTDRSALGRVFHQYVIRSARRDELRQQLLARGVQTAVHYPEAVHQQAAYAHRVHIAGGLPETERAVAEILSFPMFQALTDDEVDHICTVAGELLS